MSQFGQWEEEDDDLETDDMFDNVNKSEMIKKGIYHILLEFSSGFRK